MLLDHPLRVLIFTKASEFRVAQVIDLRFILHLLIGVHERG
jgi:hypothetical protein